MDAEFYCADAVPGNGWPEANTLRALERARETKALAAADADQLIENYRQLPAAGADFTPLEFRGRNRFCRTRLRRITAFPCAVVSRLPEAFRAALAKWRQAIREVYSKVFQP